MKRYRLGVNPFIQKMLSLASSHEHFGNKRSYKHVVRDFTYASENIECQKYD